MEFLGTTLVPVGCAAGMCGVGWGGARGAAGGLARTIHHAAGEQLARVDVLTRRTAAVAHTVRPSPDVHLTTNQMHNNKPYA